MALTNYTELQASIADWLVRDDATTVIPDFIRMAEAEFNRGLDHWRQEASTTLTVSTQTTALPADFLGVKTLANGADRMELISRADMQQRREDDDTGGNPTHYCILGGVLEVYPTPDESTSMVLIYRAEVPELATTNWLMDQSPDLYLYGSLVHAFAWAKDAEAAMMHKAKADECLRMINRESKRGQMSGSGLRIPIRKF